MNEKEMFFLFLKTRIKGKTIKRYLNVLIWQTRDIANFAMLLEKSTHVNYLSLIPRIVNVKLIHFLICIFFIEPIL